jgi:MoxR-like ATPase
LTQSYKIKQLKKTIMAQVNLNIDDLTGFMGHIIKNNRFLQAQGKLPVAVEVLGESGIGKTSTVKQIAEEHNLDFVKLNLAQIEELGDLVGFPVREFQMYKEQVVSTNNNKNSIAYGAKTAASKDVMTLSNNTSVTKKIGQWVSELAVSDYLNNGYKMTGKNRMSYAAPEWIADKKNGGILLLDDWNRADK